MNIDKANNYTVHVSRGVGSTEPIFCNSQRTIASIIPDAGSTARIETTMSSVENVNAGTAVWETWTYGDVASIRTGTMYSPVAFRMTVTAGTATLNAKAVN